MTLDQWREKSSAARVRADRVYSMILDRARDVARAAGLDQRAPFHHAHNALLAADAGTPWPEVDYSRARLLRRLEALSLVPNRLAWAYSDRLWQSVGR